MRWFATILLCCFAKNLYSSDNLDKICSKQWFEDRDSDGFGNPEVWTISCEQPQGYVDKSGDCNDDLNNRGSIFYPGAKEPCNYDDFNCDGIVNFCPYAPPVKKVHPQKDAFILTSFTKDHPFTPSNSGSHNLSDSLDVFPGIMASQSVSITSDGQSSIKSLQALNLESLDFSGLMPKIWIKVDNVKHLTDLSLFLGNKKFKNFVRFRINSSQGQQWITDGDWVAISIAWNSNIISQTRLEPGLSLQELRKNITDIKIQIKDDQKAPVTLHINRISAVYEGTSIFPNGVISFTFDDGLESQFSIAKQKLDTYSYSATAYIIIGFLDTANYLTTAQLKELHNANWEIGFHAFDPAMHMVSYTNFSKDMVERDILTGKQWFFENGFFYQDQFSNNILNFAYPKGEFKQIGKTDIVKLASNYFSSARTINERQQEVTPPSDPYKLRVLYVTAPEDVKSVFEKTEKACRAKEWTILVFHDLVENPQSNDQWQIEKFNSLIDMISSKLSDVPVRTVKEVLSFF